MSLKKKTLAFVFAVFCTFAILSSCTKINICGNTDKVVGTWEVKSWSIGDSLLDITAPIDTLHLTFTFADNATMFYNVFGMVTEGDYQIYRYEQKCIIEPSIFEFNWEIERLSSSEMDIKTWTLIPDTAGVDILTDVTIELASF